MFLGALAVLGVVAFWFPGAFSSAAFRAHYPIPLLRALLEVAIGLAFLLGAVSLVLRRRKVLGLAGIGLALAATLAGGGSVPIESRFDQPLTLGLDWFLLNLLLLALVFVPLERAFARLPQQTTFRRGWTTDGAHFMVSHLRGAGAHLPDAAAGDRARDRCGSRRRCSGRSGAAARAAGRSRSSCSPTSPSTGCTAPSTRCRWLWRFHAIHHSSRALDWLAGSRLHLVDVVVTRGLVLVPLFLLGFAQPALYAYLVFVSFHAVFIHANVRFRFGWLDRVLATPRFHHWHHAVGADRQELRGAPAGHRRLFGTLHLPGDEWPAGLRHRGPPGPRGLGRAAGAPVPARARRPRGRPPVRPADRQ